MIYFDRANLSSIYLNTFTTWIQNAFWYCPIIDITFKNVIIDLFE